MLVSPAEHVATRLTLIFKDEILSFNAPANITYGELARTMDGLPLQRYHDLVAIEVTPARPRLSRQRRPQWSRKRNLLASTVQRPRHRPRHGHRRR